MVCPHGDTLRPEDHRSRCKSLRFNLLELERLGSGGALSSAQPSVQNWSSGGYPLRLSRKSIIAAVDLMGLAAEHC